MPPAATKTAKRAPRHNNVPFAFVTMAKAPSLWGTSNNKSYYRDAIEKLVNAHEEWIKKGAKPEDRPVLSFERDSVRLSLQNQAKKFSPPVNLEYTTQFDDALKVNRLYVRFVKTRGHNSELLKIIAENPRTKAELQSTYRLFSALQC